MFIAKSGAIILATGAMVNNFFPDKCVKRYTKLPEKRFREDINTPDLSHHITENKPDKKCGAGLRNRLPFRCLVLHYFFRIFCLQHPVERWPQRLLLQLFSAVLQKDFVSPARAVRQ